MMGIAQRAQKRIRILKTKFDREGLVTEAKEIRKGFLEIHAEFQVPKVET